MSEEGGVASAKLLSWVTEDEEEAHGAPLLFLLRMWAARLYSARSKKEMA